MCRRAETGKHANEAQVLRVNAMPTKFARAIQRQDMRKYLLTMARVALVMLHAIIMIRLMELVCNAKEQQKNGAIIRGLTKIKLIWWIANQWMKMYGSVDIISAPQMM